MSLKGQTVLVTGATGFIGSRLVQWLHEVEGARVVALVHQFKNASRIARFPIELRRGDVLDVDSLRKAAKGCSHIVHGAVTFAGSAQENRRVTLGGANNICRVAREGGVGRLVYLSTISVYGITPGGSLNESTRCHPEDGYGRDKLDAETVFQRAHSQALESVILRLPVVYGPWSFWSTYPMGQLARGRVILPDDGAGLCNALYVDDAIRAVIGALQAKLGGEAVTCLVSGEPVTWRDFYEGHGQALNSVFPLGGMSSEAIRRRLTGTTWTGLLWRLWALRGEVRIIMRLPGATTVWRKLRPLLKAAAKRQPVGTRPGDSIQSQPPEILPDAGHVNLMANQSRADISVACSALGFQPHISFHEGMTRTVAWARWAQLG